ncbi:hypothetical protein MD484_g670, partial [Candolleomyces efflorescens]
MSSSDNNSKNDSDLKVEDIEKYEAAPVPIDAHYDPKFVQKTIRMVDWRMLPLLGLLYAVALVDRANLGIARTAGMGTDLELGVGERYSIASMIYFVPYIILQVPTNLILRKLGAQLFLTICVVGWGAAQLGMGFVPNWGLLSLCRVLLGVFEAGFFPALVFIITTWYKRHEVQKRLAVFYLSSIVIAGFSSILAYAITFLKGKGNLNGWQWIFIIEGILTIVLGLFTWFFVADFPDKARFLNDEQRKMILDRIEADRADAMPDKITKEKFIKSFFDPLTWSFAIMFLSSTMATYTIGFFSTIIIYTLGYTEAMALVLTAFPYVAAAISCFFFAWLSDKTKKRAPWLAVQNCITLTGIMLLGYAKQPGVRYFGIFLTNMGGSGCIPGILAYHSNNITSHSKRAVSTAVIVACGGIGGIFSTTVYRQKDYPRYIPGIWATVACQLTMMSLLAINSFVFTRRNRLYREGKRGPLEDTPGFYYTI